MLPLTGARSWRRLEVIIKNAKAGDGITDTVHKFKLWDKVRALETLAKDFGLLKDRVELTDSGDLIAILHAGRQRTAELKTQRDQQKQLAGL